jgi:SAM-dependent methyltransferase
MWEMRVAPLSSLPYSRSRRAWEDVAGWWSSKVGTRGDINREWIIDPVILWWLGPLRGKQVLDAGSGTGYLSFILARRGATVTGVEHSARLVEIARRSGGGAGREVRFVRSSLSRMRPLRSSSFDLAVANVVLQDVTDLRGALREIARVLRPGGRFVFSITHPCFEAPVPARKTRAPPDSQRDEDWTMTVDRYFDRVALWWSAPGSPPVAGYHRPLRDYFDALAQAGLVVSRLEEPRPVRRALAVNFRLFADQERIPNFVVIEALKPKRRID